MTATQLQLIDVPAVPSLTARQQRALELVQAAAADGIHADELGARLHEERPGRWQHPRDDRCPFCGSTGKEVLAALKRKGLVKYRRGSRGVAGYWVAVSAPQGPVALLEDGWSKLLESGF